MISSHLPLLGRWCILSGRSWGGGRMKKIIKWLIDRFLIIRSRRNIRGAQELRKLTRQDIESLERTTQDAKDYIQRECDYINSKKGSGK